MKLYGILLFCYKDNNTDGDSNIDPKKICLSKDFDVDEKYGYFQRTSAKEFMEFFAKQCAEKIKQGQPKSYDENEGQEMVLHCYHRFNAPQGLTGVVISDTKYDQRVAYSVLNKAMDDFCATQKGPLTVDMDFLKAGKYLSTDPNTDPIIKVKMQLEDTTKIMRENIQSVTERGEKLDALIERSEELSFQSKAFHKAAKKTNSCCVLM